VSVVELRHGEKRMMESAVSSDKPHVDGLKLTLMVDATSPAVSANVDT
jgi:hypothetical protein